jgi:hypothetical protein
MSLFEQEETEVTEVKQSQNAKCKLEIDEPGVWSSPFPLLTPVQKKN